MTHWRPVQRIRVVAIGLLWRGDALLVAEVRDDAQVLRGVRPLGGGIEFGETWAEALAREFREELAVEIEILGAPLVIENLFEHEGDQGHEIIFAAEIAVPPGALDGRDEIVFTEAGGAVCRARWVDIAALDADGPALFPTGLKDLIASGRRAALA